MSVGFTNLRNDGLEHKLLNLIATNLFITSSILQHRTQHGVKASCRSKDSRRCDSSGEAGESKLEGLNRRPAQHEDAEFMLQDARNNE